MKLRIVTLTAAVALGCEAEPAPTGPASVPAVDASPTLQVDVPSEFSRSPSASVRAEAGFEGDRAFGITGMHYWANRAKLAARLHVRDGARSYPARERTAEQTFFLPGWRHIPSSLDLAVDRSCGHVAEVQATGTAWHQFLLKASLLEWGHATGYAHDADRQPSCRSECDSRFFLDPEDEDRSCVGGSPDGDSDPDDDGDDGGDGEETTTLDCVSEWVVVTVDDRTVYEGWADVCG